MAVGKVNVGGINPKKLRGFHLVADMELMAIGDYFVRYTRPEVYKNRYEIYDDDMNLLQTVDYAPGGGNYAYPGAITMDSDLNFYATHTIQSTGIQVRKFNKDGIIADVTRGANTSDTKIIFLMSGKVYTKAGIFTADNLTYSAPFAEANNNNAQGLFPNYNENTIFVTAQDGGTNYDSIKKYTPDKVLIYHSKVLNYVGNVPRLIVISTENDIAYISDGSRFVALNIATGAIVAQTHMFAVGTMVHADEYGIKSFYRFTSSKNLVFLETMPKVLRSGDNVSDNVPNLPYEGNSVGHTFFTKKYKLNNNKQTVFATMNGKTYRYQFDNIKR